MSLLRDLELSRLHVYSMKLLVERVTSLFNCNGNFVTLQAI